MSENEHSILQKRTQKQNTTLLQKTNSLFKIHTYSILLMTMTTNTYSNIYYKQYFKTIYNKQKTHQMLINKNKQLHNNTLQKNIC